MLENIEAVGLAGLNGFGTQVGSISTVYPNLPEIATFNVVDLQAERVRRLVRVSAPVARLIAAHAYNNGRRA